MTAKAYVVWTTNFGEIPLSQLLDGQTMQNPVISGGTITDTVINTDQTSHIGMLTTTQIGLLTAAQLGNLATYTAVSTTQVTTQLSTLTDNTVFLFGLKTVGGTPGTPVVKTVDKSSGKITIASDPGDTSTYNVVGMG